MKRNIRLTQKLELLAKKRKHAEMLQKFTEKISGLDCIKELIDGENAHELATEIFRNIPKEPVCIYYGDLECRGYIESYIKNLNKNTDFYIIHDFNQCGNDIKTNVPILLVNSKSIIDCYDALQNTAIHQMIFYSKDLRKGLFIDIYATDPELHDTCEEAVYEFFEWALF